MSFPRYPKYKDSGVEWLGNVPEHWEVGKCGFYLTVLSGFAFPSAGFSGDASNAKLLRGINVGVSKLKWDETVYWQRMEGDDLDIYELTAGDVVIGMDRPLIGDGMRVAKVTPSDLPCLLLQRVASLNTDDRLLGDYLLGFLSSEMFVAHFSPETTGVSVPHISPEQIGNFVIAVPPLHEQARIVAFLDCETAKIDELVAEQRRLIELLKEKRQAVISHAVTKGLNPNVPLKPSGIEWLGDVPEHWDVLNVRRISLSVQTGGTPSTVLPADHVDAGHVWYTPGDFSESLRLTNSARMLPLDVVESGDAKVFPPRSVLVVSIGATLGKVGFAEGASAANQQINAVIPNEKIDGYFLAYSLSAKAEVMRFLSNASTIGIMNQEKTKDIWLSVPPSLEQAEVTKHLDAESAKLAALTAEAEHAVQLLQERRTALISAAVTGKIDVRNFAPQVSEVA